MIMSAGEKGAWPASFPITHLSALAFEIYHPQAESDYVADAANERFTLVTALPASAAIVCYVKLRYFF